MRFRSTFDRIMFIQENNEFVTMWLINDSHKGVRIPLAANKDFNNMDDTFLRNWIFI